MRKSFPLKGLWENPSVFLTLLKQSRNMVHKQIGETVKRIRRKVGYSQDEVARFIGIDQTAMSRIENGKQTLSIVHLIKLSKLFRCSTDDILKEK